MYAEKPYYHIGIYIVYYIHVEYSLYCLKKYFLFTYILYMQSSLFVKLMSFHQATTVLCGLRSNSALCQQLTSSGPDQSAGGFVEFQQKCCFYFANSVLEHDYKTVPKHLFDSWQSNTNALQFW